MKFIKKYILLICLFNYGCNKKEISIQYYPNGSVKSLYLLNNSSQNSRQLISFYESGKIESIANLKDTLMEGERLHFYDKTGTIDSKINFKDGIPNGNAYWFYESGALKSSRNYVNGIETYIGFDYWDKRFVINKSLLRFNDRGKIFYKLNFDSIGNPANSEGDSLNSGVLKVKKSN